MSNHRQERQFSFIGIFFWFLLLAEFLVTGILFSEKVILID
jgi:hypothetical protein